MSRGVLNGLLGQKGRENGNWKLVKNKEMGNLNKM